MKKSYIVVTSLIGIVLIVLAAFAYRNNRIVANTKVNAIIAADNDKQDTAKLRDDLKAFSSQRMNASTSVTLEASYNRDTAQAKADAESVSKYTIDVYKEAVVACPPKLNSVNAANCIKQYVDSHSNTGNRPVTPRPIDKASYTYSYSSPRWSWDASGWLFVSGTAFLILSLVLTIIYVISQRTRPASAPSAKSGLPMLKRK